MTARARIFLMLWLLLWFPWASASAGQAGFVFLTNQFAGPPLVGYGAEMSPYLTAPSEGVPVGDLSDLERKLKALAPQHVRIFVLPKWWEPGNENLRDSFVRTCQMAQSAGATINVTLWHGWTNDPPGSSRRMARLLQDLVRNRSLTAVRYVTLQNEVNSTRITMDSYDAFYRMFDHDLRAVGLRDQIQIVGGDLLRKKEAAWFENLATELADVCDGYSVHMYWEYPQAADYIRRRMNEIALIQDGLPARERRPLFITEFGVRGKDWHERGKEPGVYEGGSPIVQTAVQALQIGWLMTEATRRGYVATVQWEAYDVGYPRIRMHYGLLGEARQGWPLRPAYQVLRLFTHTVASGWRAVRLEGDSSEVALAAVQGPKAGLTLMALNHSERAQPISIGGLRPNLVFRRLLWAAGDKDRLRDLGDLASSAASLELSLPPRSLTALTAGSERWKELNLAAPDR
jgi:hypothetical protein